jgi:hypothetical protein
MGTEEEVEEDGDQEDSPLKRPKAAACVRQPASHVSKCKMRSATWGAAAPPVVVVWPAEQYPQAFVGWGQEQ